MIAKTKILIYVVCYYGQYKMDNVFISEKAIFGPFKKESYFLVINMITVPRNFNALLQSLQW